MERAQPEALATACPKHIRFRAPADQACAPVVSFTPCPRPLAQPNTSLLPAVASPFPKATTSAAFPPAVHDLLGLEQLLGPEERALRDRVRAYMVRDRVRAYMVRDRVGGRLRGRRGVVGEGAG